jgi:hypothetical protein
MWEKEWEEGDTEEKTRSREGKEKSSKRRVKIWEKKDEGKEEKADDSNEEKRWRLMMPWVSKGL